MQNFSKRACIKSSATGELSCLVKDMQSLGIKIHNLGVGEPNIELEYQIKKSAHKSIDNNKNSYPPVPGFKELRDEASKWMNRSYKTDFKTENTIVVPGGKFGVFLSLGALINHGDEVVIISPYWVSYPQIAEFFGAKVRILKTNEKNGWKIAPKDIQKICTQKTKAIIINNACNPTGTLYDKRELKEILSKIPKHMWIISDEVYSGLTYDGKKYTSCGEFKEYKKRLLIIQSCSKNFGMIGLRVGFVFGPKNIIKILAKLQSQSATCASSVSQCMALEAVKNAGIYQRKMRDEMQKRRDFFVTGLEEIFSRLKMPSSALYLFLPLKYFDQKGKNDILFCKQMLQKYKIAMLPGTAFGCKGFVRIAFCETQKNLKASLKQLSLKYKPSIMRS